MTSRVASRCNGVGDDDGAAYEAAFTSARSRGRPPAHRLPAASTAPCSHGDNSYALPERVCRQLLEVGMVYKVVAAVHQRAGQGRPQDMSWDPGHPGA
jgi:hypothetical protein